MSTVVMLGPRDHGRPLSVEEFESARWQDGYKYELISGRLYVSPLPDLPHDQIVRWINRVLDDYARARPEIINYVTPQARVFVPRRRSGTQPEPDLAAFADFPLHLPIRSVQREDVSPLLVAEFVSEDDPDKDLVRNVEVYERVPSVREYWIIDPRADADRPDLRVYRRRGQRWQKPIDVPAGGTYTTRLLPGFTLTVDPRA
jgi:Uma2 family endonuclease